MNTPAQMKLAAKVRARALNACEAMVEMPRARARCGKTPVEDHHLLPRARGGGVLDELGEIYHHLALCRDHHREAHDTDGIKKGLLLGGSVYIDGGRVVYVGTNDYLTEKYPPRVHS